MVAELVELVDDGTISSKQAKEVFAEMAETGDAPGAIVELKGMKQVSDTGAIEEVVDRVMAANPGQVEQYRGGKTGVIGYFVGQVMREMGGQANPAVVNEVLKKKLDELASGRVRRSVFGYPRDMDLTNPIILAFLTGLFTYFMTAVGAAGVFLHRNPSDRADGRAARVLRGSHARGELLVAARSVGRDREGPRRPRVAADRARLRGRRPVAVGPGQGHAAHPLADARRADPRGHRHELAPLDAARARDHAAPHSRGSRDRCRRGRRRCGGAGRQRGRGDRAGPRARTAEPSGRSRRVDDARPRRRVTTPAGSCSDR